MGLRHRRTHAAPEAAKMAVPRAARNRSVSGLNGNLWPGAGARREPGERVGMTVYFKRMSVDFNRMSVRPQEDLNAVISDEAIARNPPLFAH
jgi:hypothetical protein|tara:strand:+ start:1887 stop:2162 length:276 start_codon:yes stop_codon:yes gene_type:complete